MTREGFRQRARLRLRQFFGTAVGGDPITLDQFVTEAVAETAQTTDACYGGRKTNLVAGKVFYCQPALYKVKRVLVMNGFGKYCPVTTYRDEREADKRIPGWRDQPSGHPCVAVFMGVNAVEFDKTPTETLTNGVEMKGFYRPPGSDWPDGDDESPLAQHIGADEAALSRLLYECCRFDERKAVQALAASFLAEWEQRCGDLEATVALHHSRVN